jgi:nucleotide-binding universal stress UspA family protein
VFRKVQAAVDGLPRSRDAAALGEAMAGAVRADLLLVGAFQDPLLPFPPVFSSDAHPGREAQEALSIARSKWAPSGHTFTVPDVSPARALRRTIRERGADLFVLGSGRHVPEGRAGAGHTGRQILHGAPCAVAVAAAGLHASGAALDRIVVGIDDGPEAATALRVAAELARMASARITAVAVVDDRPDVQGWPPEVIGEIVAWEDLIALRRRQTTAGLDQLLETADVPVMGAVRTGDPAGELYAAAQGADLLVIGSRGWGARDRIAVGSTAEALSHDAPCSLLVLPRVGAARARAPVARRRPDAVGRSRE